MSVQDIWETISRAVLDCSIQLLPQLWSEDGDGMRIKGKYVASVEVDFDFEHKPSHLPFDQIRNKIVGGYLTNEIKEAMDEEFFSDDDGATVTVTQQYADVYEVTE